MLVGLVWGLVKFLSKLSNVSNSYATSEVSGYSAVGGLVGKIILLP